MYKAPFIILLMVTLTAAQLDVIFMVTEDRSHWNEAIFYLEDDGRFGEVDYYDLWSYNAPPLGYFQMYDVVVVGGLGDIKQSVVFGDRLADYADGGGCVVVDAGQLYRVRGRWRDEGYPPYYSETDDMLEGEEDLIIDEPGHAILEGVSGLWGCYWRADVLLRPGADELAHFPDSGGVAVNARQNVVGLNYMCGAHGWTGDGYLILANAACWLAAHSDVREMSWGGIKAVFE